MQVKETRLPQLTCYTTTLSDRNTRLNERKKYEILKMRVIVFKLFFWLYVAGTINSISDQNANIESKNAYIESELKNRLGTKSRYASIFNANSKNSQSSSYTSQRWFYQPSNSKYNDNNLNSVHLRHSKHPNINAVSTRLDELRTRHIVVTTTTTTTTPKYQYQKYRGISDNLLTEDDSIEELFDYDDDNDDSDNLPDYDSWDSAGKDDDDFDDDDDDNEWQAEEATETPLAFGTENRSKENIVEHSNLNFSYMAAFQHTIKMNSHRCHYPLPRVLSVQTIHPDPGKSYMPHCTVLHRCSADTGCCNTHSKTCAPMKQAVVYLYFYTTRFGQQVTKIEKLPFYNHTECACLDKQVEPTTMETTTTEPSRDGIRSYRSNLSVRAADSSLYSPETIRRCKCPTEYNSLLDFENKCSCDCADNNKDCIHIKKGNENFSLKDRICIMNEECGIPKCEYGPYIRQRGRCPGKKEKLDAFASVSPKFK